MSRNGLPLPSLHQDRARRAHQPVEVGREHVDRRARRARDGRARGQGRETVGIPGSGISYTNVDSTRQRDHAGGEEQQFESARGRILLWNMAFSECELLLPLSARAGAAFHDPERHAARRGVAYGRQSRCQ